MNASAERFDGAAAWARLTSDERTAIGAAACELVVAWHGEASARTADEARPYEDAEPSAFTVMVIAALSGLLAHGLIAEGEILPVPSLLGTICVVCGWSNRNAYVGVDHPPRHMASPDRCSACAAVEAA